MVVSDVIIGLDVMAYNTECTPEHGSSDCVGDGV